MYNSYKICTCTYHVFNSVKFAELLQQTVNKHKHQTFITKGTYNTRSMFTWKLMPHAQDSLMWLQASAERLSKWCYEWHSAYNAKKMPSLFPKHGRIDAISFQFSE